MCSRGGYFQYFLGISFFFHFLCVLTCSFKKSIRCPFVVCIVLLLLLEEVGQVPACRNVALPHG